MQNNFTGNQAKESKRPFCKGEWKSLIHVQLFVTPWATKEALVRGKRREIEESVICYLLRDVWLSCNARDQGSIPGLGRSPGERNSYPLQYSGLENSTDCMVHGVTKSRTQLRNFHFTSRDGDHTSYLVANLFQWLLRKHCHLVVYWDYCRQNEKKKKNLQKPLPQPYRWAEKHRIRVWTWLTTWN